MSAANPKYKVGDVLVLTSADPQLEFKILSMPIREGIPWYVMQNLTDPGAAHLEVPVDNIDADTYWALKPGTESKPINWLLIGLGGAAAAALLVAVVMMTKRNRA